MIHVPRRCPAQVGTSPCHFLSVTARVTRDPESGSHRGEALLRFGRPEPSGKPTHCRPAAESDGPLGFEWPRLEGVKVLGWGRELAWARAELVLPADDCRGGALRVVQSAPLPVGQVRSCRGCQCTGQPGRALANSRVRAQARAGAGPWSMAEAEIAPCVLAGAARGPPAPEPC